MKDLRWIGEIVGLNSEGLWKKFVYVVWDYVGTLWKYQCKCIFSYIGTHSGYQYTEYECTRKDLRWIGYIVGLNSKDLWKIHFQFYFILLSLQPETTYEFLSASLISFKLQRPYPPGPGPGTRAKLMAYGSYLRPATMHSIHIYFVTIIFLNLNRHLRHRLIGIDTGWSETTLADDK